MSFPPLESLTLSGYRFQDQPNGQKWAQQKPEKPPKKVPRPPRNRMSQFIMDHSGDEQSDDQGGIRGFCLQREPPAVKPQGRTNLETWLEMMDWSRLHTLQLSNPQVYELEKLTGSILTSLKNVKFEEGDLAAVASFLGNISTSLESIRLEGVDGGWTERRNSGDALSFHKILDEILAKHSRKLRDLKIIQAGCYHDERYPEMYCSGHNRGSLFLNSTHLIGLQRFSHLESLELDYNVGEEWDYAFLDAIAEIKTLRRVTLRLLKLSGPQTRYLHILAPGIEMYLRQIKKGVAFEKVEIDCYSYHGD